MTTPDILLVDDDPNFIHHVGRLLAGHARLRVARSGNEALRLAAQSPPDLMLLDIDMPGMDGLETCRRLKSAPATEHTGVIFVTGTSGNVGEFEALAVGGHDYLRKPLEPTQLLARVEAHWRGRGRRGPARAAAGAARPPKILLVDNDPSALEALREALEGLGALFIVSCDGEDALRQARLVLPDLAVVELALPGIDGVELTRRLRAERHLRQIPVLAVTGSADADAEIDALRAGADDFVHKVTRSPVLHARAAALLQRRAALQRQRQEEHRQWERQGELRLAELVAAASDAIVGVDARGTICVFNPAAGRLTGLDPAAVLGLPWLALADLPWNASLADVDGPRPGETRLATGTLRREGQALPVEWTYSVDGVGAARLAVVVVRELGERLRAEQEARARAQAEAESRTKTMMLSFLAHEIGNPLNGILGLGRVALNDAAEPLPPGQHKRLQRMLACAATLHGLMRDVLDVARFDAGRFELHPHDLDAAAAATVAWETLSGQAELGGVQLQPPQVAGPLPLVRADPLRLQQCLVNVLGNAVKYSRQGGRVALRLSARADEVAIEVHDDGPGMTQEQMARLFTPFDRLGREGGAAGTGVGLYFTRRLLQAMGGRIEVHSVAGEGTRVALFLPAAAGDSRA